MIINFLFFLILYYKDIHQHVFKNTFICDINKLKTIMLKSNF